MANIKFELQNQSDLSLEKKTKVALTDLEAELIKKRDELLTLKTVEEASIFLENIPVVADATKKVIIIGDKYIESDPANSMDYEANLSRIRADIATANDQIEKAGIFKDIEKVEVEKNIAKDFQQHKEITTKFVTDKTFENATIQADLEKNNALKSFLTGKNDFETSLEGYHNAENEAFRNMLLTAMQTARDRYTNISTTGGKVEFTPNERYTLQFADKYKKELKGNITPAKWQKLLYEYRGGLNADGLPRNIEGFKNPDNSVMTVEKTPSVNTEKKESTVSLLDKPASELTDTEIKKMSEADVTKKIQEAIAEIYANAFKNAGNGLVLRQEAGKNILTLSEKQYKNFEALGRLGYINERVASTQERPKRTSRQDREIMKLRKKVQEANERRDPKSADLSAKLAQLEKEQADAAAATNYNMQKAANYEAYRAKNAGDAAAAAAIGETIQLEGYTGITYLVKPAAPVFMNICRNVCAKVPDVGGMVDLGNGIQAVIECPELAKKYNQQVNNYINYTNPYSYNECTNGGRENVLQKLLREHTNMSDAQAKKNADLITAGGIGVGLFFLGKWLFTGKTPDGKESKAGGFFGRAGILLGGAIGINMLSEGLTGNKAMDIIKGLWYGDIKLSDLLSGKVGKENWLGCRYDIAGKCLRGVPMSVLSTCVTEGPGGVAKFNLTTLDNYITQRLVDPTLSETEKNNLALQQTAIRTLKAEPNGEAELAKIAAEMGITYGYITNPLYANETANKVLDEANKRAFELQQHLTKYNYQLAVPDTDPDIISYYKTGKPTIEELGKKGKFTTKKIEETVNNNIEIRDEALKQIDPKQAVILQNALNKVHGTISFKNDTDRPRFEYKNGILYVRSYGLDTPIFQKDGNYQLGKLDIGFPSPESAIKTASLINFLVLTNNGARDVDAPFSVTGSSLKVGNQDLTGWKWLDKSRLAQWAKKYFGNTEVVDSDDRKVFPWRESTMDKIGGVELGSVAGMEKFKNYLNGMRNAKGSIWRRENGGVTTMDELIEYTTGVGGTTSVVEATKKNNTSGTDKSESSDKSSKDSSKTESSDKSSKKPSESDSENKESAWKSMKEWTKEKRDGFKNAVGKTTTAIGGFFTGVFTGEIFHKPDSAQVAAFRKEMEYYKKELADFEKMDSFKKKSVADAQEIEALRLNIDENYRKLEEIQKLAVEEIDPGLNKAVKIPEAQKKELTFSKKRLNFETKFKTQNDRAHLTSTPRGTAALVSNNKEITPIKFENSSYYIEGLNVPFASADEIVRIANLTNFIKANFRNRASAKVNIPWKVSGNDLQFNEKTWREGLKSSGNILGIDTTVGDGEDRFSSTLKFIGGTGLQSRVGEFAQYLNSMLEDDGKTSIWVQKESHGIDWQVLQNFRNKVESEVQNAINGPYRANPGEKMYKPETPDEYKGYEPIGGLAKVKTIDGYVALETHNNSINILENPNGTFQIGYINKKPDGSVLKNYLLGIEFPTLHEAIRVANIINYFKKVYLGHGTSNHSFNIGMWSGDLEFAEDGLTDGIDLEALNKRKTAQLISVTLANGNGLVTLKDWLNKMPDTVREHK